MIDEQREILLAHMAQHEGAERLGPALERLLGRDLARRPAARCPAHRRPERRRHDEGGEEQRER
jgi:hypothetical protein